jgi:hypothetical protein
MDAGNLEELIQAVEEELSMIAIRREALQKMFQVMPSLQMRRT